MGFCPTRDNFGNSFDEMICTYDMGNVGCFYDNSGNLLFGVPPGTSECHGQAVSPPD